MSIIDNLIKNDSNFSKNGLLGDIDDTSNSDNYDKLIKYKSAPPTDTLRNCDTQTKCDWQSVITKRSVIGTQEVWKWNKNEPTVSF